MRYWPKPFIETSIILALLMVMAMASPAFALSRIKDLADIEALDRYLATHAAPHTPRIALHSA